MLLALDLDRYLWWVVMLLIALPLSAVWGGLWWRLRGGAMTAITGFNPGTNGMRAIAGVGIAAPLVVLGWWWALMMPAFTVAWMLAGWAAFQGMTGHHGPGISEKNWLSRLLIRFGLHGIDIDVAGMAIEGMIVMAVLGAVVGWIEHGWLVGLVVMLCGAMFSPIYRLMDRISVPDFGSSLRGGTQWAEVLVGAWVGLVIVASALLR
jgi:hypothetical protein